MAGVNDTSAREDAPGALFGGDDREIASSPTPTGYAPPQTSARAALRAAAAARKNPLVAV